MDNKNTVSIILAIVITTIVVWLFFRIIFPLLAFLTMVLISIPIIIMVALPIYVIIRKKFLK